MIYKFLFAWTLLSITVQGLRMHAESSTDREQSELHGQESAAKVRPWQALMALLLAYKPSPSEAFAFGPLAPHAGPSHSFSGAVRQGPAFSGTPASVLGSGHMVSRGTAPEMIERGGAGQEIFENGDEVRVLYPSWGFEGMRNHIGIVTGYAQSYRFDGMDGVGSGSESNRVWVRFPNGREAEFEPDQLGLLHHSGQTHTELWSRGEHRWNPEQDQRMVVDRGKLDLHRLSKSRLSEFPGDQNWIWPGYPKMHGYRQPQRGALYDRQRMNQMGQRGSYYDQQRGSYYDQQRGSYYDRQGGYYDQQRMNQMGQRASYPDRQRGGYYDRQNGGYRRSPAYRETQNSGGMYNDYGNERNTGYTMSDNGWQTPVTEYRRMRRQGLANPWQRNGHYVRQRTNQDYGDYEEYNTPWNRGWNGWRTRTQSIRPPPDVYPIPPLPPDVQASRGTYNGVPLEEYNTPWRRGWKGWRHRRQSIRGDVKNLLNGM